MQITNAEIIWRVEKLRSSSFSPYTVSEHQKFRSVLPEQLLIIQEPLK